MNVLVLAAHPDDETLGCGGTISKLSSQGNKVGIMTFTDGVSSRESSDVGSRFNSVVNAAFMLGATSLSTFDYPDNELDTVSLLTLNRRIEAQLAARDFMPDMIITHNPWCLNIDHKRVFECAQVIARMNSKCKLMCFEIPSSSEWNYISEFRPNVFVSLDKKDAMKKIDVLNSFYSEELRKYPHPRSIQNIENTMKVVGAKIQENYAEQFMLLKDVM